MNRTYKALRKTVVFLVGIVVIIAGLILLVIPGPGLLTIAVGLVILSTEFEWAEKHLRNVKQRIRAVYYKSKNKQEKSENTRKKEK